MAALLDAYKSELISEYAKQEERHDYEKKNAFLNMNFEKSWFFHDNFMNIALESIKLQ